ncbi:CAP domain-containing protein [Lutibacter sp.]|uniref:CAP domain-containing protein n=1 Tax=Lutibacter sp. TaxID=1925666 RepID=UPI0035670E81
MKSFFQPLLLVAIFSFVLFSCSQEDDGIYFTESVEEYDLDNVSYSELETEILTLVNNYRESIGLTSLSNLDIVSSVADGHTNYMIENGKVSHDNFDQRSQALMTNASAKSVAENVAYGYTTAQGVLDGWLNSASHKAVIENPNFTHFGISTETNASGRNYFTHIFIKK